MDSTCFRWLFRSTLLASAVLALLLANKPTTSELLNGSLLTICCTHFLRRHNIWTYAGFGLVSVLTLVRNKNNLPNQSLHWDVRLLGPPLTFQSQRWEEELGDENCGFRKAPARGVSVSFRTLCRTPAEPQSFFRSFTPTL